jgi:hypothetical protein
LTFIKPMSFRAHRSSVPGLIQIKAVATAAAIS